MVVAKDLDRNHSNCLALRRVDLARHDGGAWFVGWNREFAYSRPRTTGVPTNVVGDLHEGACKCSERSTHAHHAIVRGERRELIWSRDKWLARLLGDSPGRHLPKAWISVEPRADRRASDRQRIHPRERLANAVECLVELRNPTRDHLAQGQRRRVLKMGPTYDNNVAIGLPLRGQHVA